MGSSHYVYVGPYFRCVTPIVDKPTTVRCSCPNRECKNHGNEVPAQFCSKCGTRTSEVKGTMKGPAITMNDVMVGMKNNLGMREDALGYMTNGSGPIVKSELGRGFSSVQVDLWQGNSWPQGYRPMRSYVFEQNDESSEQELPPEVITQEKNLLREAFSHAYEVLEELYGKANVKVCWGIISYDY